MTEVTNAQIVHETDKKYVLTDETVEHSGVILYRIKAVRDIPLHNVKAGDLGGYIEKERSLDHGGDAWVSGNAWVYRKPRARCDE